MIKYRVSVIIENNKYSVSIYSNFEREFGDFDKAVYWMREVTSIFGPQSMEFKILEVEIPTPILPELEV